MRRGAGGEEQLVVEEHEEREQLVVEQHEEQEEKSS